VATRRFFASPSENRYHPLTLPRVYPTVVSAQQSQDEQNIRTNTGMRCACSRQKSDAKILRRILKSPTYCNSSTDCRDSGLTNRGEYPMEAKSFSGR